MINVDEIGKNERLRYDLGSSEPIGTSPIGSGISPNPITGFGNNYDRTNAETRALLSVEQSQVEVTLQRLY